MKHGNVSAVETSRRTQPIGSRCFLLALFGMANLGVSGCGLNPPKDTKGNLPDDAVRNFIKLVEADNYKAARKLWYGPAKLGSVQLKFEDFCAIQEDRSQELQDIQGAQRQVWFLDGTCRFLRRMQEKACVFRLEDR